MAPVVWPIKVQDTVSVQVSLDGLVFNQKFVIANGITAKAILGMEFLEQERAGSKRQRNDLIH